MLQVLKGNHLLIIGSRQALKHCQSSRQSCLPGQAQGMSVLPLAKRLAKLGKLLTNEYHSIGSRKGTKKEIGALSDEMLST